jgi:O-acetylhomoserine (thiol)-lyase
MSRDQKLAPVRGITTQLLHADRRGGVEHGATHKPIHVATAFGYQRAADLIAVFQGEQSGHVYARQGNPTTAALEQKITALEGGVGTLCFATGMAAIAAVMWGLLKRGDHLVASAFLFGNTASLLQTLEAIGCEVSLVDATDASHVERALRPETRLVFVETIANPRAQVADLEGIGALCAARGVLFVVDNTMTGPCLFRPKDVGAGLVINSLTKSIGGHGNALGGAVTDTGRFDWAMHPNILPAYRRGASASWGLLQLRKKGLRDMGATLTADSAHRIATGAETLELRVERTCENALQLAGWLQDRPEVRKVHYPGLAQHPQHARARKHFTAFGAMLSFELHDDIDMLGFLDGLQLVILSSHLGDNRTLAIPVAPTIFWEAGADKRAAMGISDSLIRLAVGIEDIDDLRGDFSQALDAIAARAPG